LGQENASAQVVVHRLDGRIEAAEYHAEMHLGASDRLTGGNDALRRRGVRPAAEEKPRDRVAGVGREVELERVAARPRELANKVLAGGVVTQHEPGMTVTAAPIASIDAVAGRRQVVPLEIAFMDIVRVLEVAHRVERKPACPKMRAPAVDRLQNAAPRCTGGQRRRRRAGIGDLDPTRQDRGAVQFGAYLKGNRTNGMPQRDDHLQAAGWLGGLVETGPFPVRREQLPVEFDPERLWRRVQGGINASVVKGNVAGAVPAASHEPPFD